MLVNPSDNDVITTKRDRQRNLDEKTHLCVRCDTTCVIQELLLKGEGGGLISTNSVINNIGCLATGNTYISSRADPRLCNVCSSFTSPNSVGATIKNDSLWSAKVIYLAAFSNSGLSQVSSPWPLLSQTPDPAEICCPPKLKQSGGGSMQLTTSPVAASASLLLSVYQCVRA